MGTLVPLLSLLVVCGLLHTPVQTQTNVTTDFIDTTTTETPPSGTIGSFDIRASTRSLSVMFTFAFLDDNPFTYGGGDYYYYYGTSDQEPCFLDKFVFQIETFDVSPNDSYVTSFTPTYRGTCNRQYQYRDYGPTTNVPVYTTLDDRDYFALLELFNWNLNSENITVRMYTNDKASEGSFPIPEISENESLEGSYTYQQDYYTSLTGFDYLIDEGIILIGFQGFIDVDSVNLSQIMLSNSYSYNRDSNDTVNITNATTVVMGTTSGYVKHLAVQLGMEDQSELEEAGICQSNTTRNGQGCILILPEGFATFHDNTTSRRTDTGVNRFNRTMSTNDYPLSMIIQLDFIGFSYQLPLVPSIPFQINTYSDGWIESVSCVSQNDSNPVLSLNEAPIIDVAQSSSSLTEFSPFGGLVYDDNVGYFTCTDDEFSSVSNIIHHRYNYVYIIGGGPDSVFEVDYLNDLSISVAHADPYLAQSITYGSIRLSNGTRFTEVGFDYNISISSEPFVLEISIPMVRFQYAGRYQINQYERELAEFTIVVQGPNLQITPPVITLLNSTTSLTATCTTTNNPFDLETVWLFQGGVVSNKSTIDLDVEELDFTPTLMNTEQLVCAVLDPDASSQVEVVEERVNILLLPDPISIAGFEDGELKFLTPNSLVFSSFFECYGHYVDSEGDLYWDIEFENGDKLEIRNNSVNDQFAAQFNYNQITLTIFGTFFGDLACSMDSVSGGSSGTSVQVSTQVQVNGQDYIGFLNTSSTDTAEVLINADDDCTGRIYLDKSIPFGAEVFSYIHICANGIITVGSPRMEGAFQTEPFPTSYSVISEGGNILAPFWNDHDLRRDNAGVYYAIHDYDSEDESQQSRLEYVSDFIQEQEDNSFSGTYMISVMWENVPPFPQLEGRRNTYEAILITDGLTTYTVYTYHCAQLQWGTTVDGRTIIGYNINPDSARFLVPEDNIPSFQNHPLASFSVPINPLTGLPDTPVVGCQNLGRGSIWNNAVYKVGQAKNTTHLAGLACDEQIESDTLLETIIQNGDGGLVDLCPCSSAQAFRDALFSRVDLFSITKDEDYRNQWCFRRVFRTETIFCCYNRFRGTLTNANGLSTIVNFASEEVFLNEDHVIRRNCVLGGRINEYREKRPILTCDSYSPPAFAFCAGDPHLSSLDGAPFTFNGWGEYLLLKFDIPDGTQFEMQTRTQPVENSVLNATELVAFAFAMIPNEIVEARLNSQREVELLVGGNIITDDLANVNDTYSTSTLTIVRREPGVILATFPNGMGVVVDSSTSMLSFTMIVPDSFKGLPRGMLGNYNEDPTDDVIRRDGTIELVNVDDRLVHEVGQTWQLQDGESLFTYPEGQTFEDYAFPDHMPKFYDEIVANAPADVLQACGFNRECVYDAVGTGDINIGMETMSTIDKNVEDRILANNMPPRINGPTILYVTVGYEAVLSFNVSDDSNDFTTESVNDLPRYSNLGMVTNDYGNFTQYTFRWIPQEVVEVSLEFVATDELDASSSLTVQVFFCGCANNGNCTLDGVLDQSRDTVIMNCMCTQGWDGRFCEVDIDGCLGFECFQGSDCTDVPAPGVGAICGPCPEGYEGDGAKCADIDECYNSTDHGCQQVCENLPGSFRCTCFSGYELTSDTECRDIDECMYVNDCHQRCHNYDGGYNCSCTEGYTLNADMRTCEVDAASVCTQNSSNCAHTCVSLSGVEYCGCYPGYTLGFDGVSCNDVNECEFGASPCEQICNNLEGGYRCDCNEGYELMPDGSCEDINECQVAALQRRQLCGASQLCVNNEGGYTCECPVGTALSGGECIELVFITTPPPIVEPEIIMNTVVVELEGYTVEMFSEDPNFPTSPNFLFRTVTAESINFYCAVNDCPVTYLPEERVRRNTYTTEDVEIRNIAPGSTDSSVTFQMFVEMNGGILSGTALQNAVLENNLLYSMAQFDIISVTPLTPVEPVDPLLTLEQIIGIAVGGGLGLILIVTVMLVCVCCCCCCCRRKKRAAKKYVKQPPGSLELENPAATMPPLGDTKMTDSENLGKEEKADLA